MPELPEVETVRRGLNQKTRNMSVSGGEVLLHRSLAYPISSWEFWEKITGIAIADWQRRGKYLLASLYHPQTNANAGCLGVHLRMSGQLLWVSSDTPVGKHTRVRFFFANNSELRFVDQRTFGRIWWVPPETSPESIIPGLQKLGPEPLGEHFTPQYLQQQLQKRRRPIKTALLDQQIIAGLGNIYADEALFVAGIHPTTLCCDLTSDACQRLPQAIEKILQKAIDAGGTTFSSFLNTEGVNGNYSGVAWVYGRTGEPCRCCQTPIERLKLTGRSCHFCPQCQK